MDFLENAVSKTREVLSVTKQRTDEAVNIQKIKFKISSLESNRNKDLQRLGFAYYKLLKNTEIENEEIKSLFDSVNAKNLEIKSLKKDIADLRNKFTCPNCSAHIDEDSIYCNICGTILNNKVEEDE